MEEKKIDFNKINKCCSSVIFGIAWYNRGYYTMDDIYKKGVVMFFENEIGHFKCNLDDDLKLVFDYIKEMTGIPGIYHNVFQHDIRHFENAFKNLGYKTIKESTFTGFTSLSIKIPIKNFEEDLIKICKVLKLKKRLLIEKAIKWKH